MFSSKWRRYCCSIKWAVQSGGHITISTELALWPLEVCVGEVDKQTLFRSPQIRKFLGSFRYRKSANFLGVSVRKSQICNFSLQIENQLILTKLHNYDSNSPNGRLFKTMFYFVLWIRAFAILVRRKSMYLRTWGRFKSANHKMIGSANRESEKCHICGRSANLTNYLSRQIYGLPEFICGPPTFARFQIGHGFWNWQNLPGFRIKSKGGMQNMIFNQIFFLRTFSKICVWSNHTFV